MGILLAQLAPQRSTQYTDLVSRLAPGEILLSEVGKKVTGEIRPLVSGGVAYLMLELDGPVTASDVDALKQLATVQAFFDYYDGIGDVPGPFLKPVELVREPFLPETLVATRRYRGKTNELFTRFMCNIARYSSAYRSSPWHKLTLLDPLAGGGTTLFVGLVHGADVVGVERNRKVVEGTAGFLKAYFKEGRIVARCREERIKGAGKRWFFTIRDTTRCVIGQGDTQQVQKFVHGLKKPHLIVTDLPYGIQHEADWKAMLHEALPAWSRVLAKGGALAFAWDATRFSREKMIQLVEDVSPFHVLDDPPYNHLQHRVDRVIKKRDIIIARCA